MEGYTNIDQVYDSNLPNSSFFRFIPAFLFVYFDSIFNHNSFAHNALRLFQLLQCSPSTWHIPRVFVLNSAKFPVALLYLSLDWSPSLISKIYRDWYHPPFCFVLKASFLTCHISHVIWGCVSESQSINSLQKMVPIYIRW